MPLNGDQVGEVYVEVYADVDERALRKTEADLNKAAKRIQRNLNREMGSSFTQQIDATLKAASKSEFAAQARTAQGLARQREQALRQRAQMEKTATAERIKNEEAALRRHYSRTRSMNEEVERAHVMALKESASRAVKIEKDRVREIEVIRKKRFKDGGAPNIAEGVENLLSILPGQLEKLFRNPALASASVGLGVGIGAAITLGIGGALSAAVGGGAIIGAIVALVKNDQEVADAFSTLGDRAMSAFLDQAVKFKPAVLDLFSGMGSSISEFVRGLDLGPVIAQVRPLGEGIGKFLKEAQPGFQALIDTAGPILSDLAQFVLPALGKAFTYLGNIIKNNGDSIRFAMAAIGGAVVGVIYGLGLAIRTASGLVRIVTKLIAVAASGLLNLVQQFNAIAGKIPGIGDNLQIPTEQLIGFVNTANTMGASVLPKVNQETGALGTSLTALTGDTKGATVAATSLTEQMNAQAEAYQEAFDKQKQFDNSIVTSVDHVIAYEQLLDDTKAAVKEVGKNWSISRPQVRAAVESATGGLKDYKAKLLDAVEAGKITTAEAKRRFSDAAATIVGKFGKGSTARKAVEETATALKTFPKDVRVNLQVSGLANIRANIAELRSQLAGLQGAGAKKKAEKNLEKNKASGGAVFGPGTATSDSIPANLSNGEFVIKASSAKQIGYGNLARMNSTGKPVAAFAKGGAVGNGRGSSRSEKMAYEALLKQISALTKTITIQTKQLQAYNDQLSSSREQFKSFVNLSSLDTQGKSTGDIIGQLQARKAKTGDFTKNLAALKKKGLSATALQQVSEAGPDSELASLLLGGSSYDVGLINSLLGGGAGYASSVANTIFPKGAGTAKSLAANKKKLASKKKAAGKLKPVKAKGATVSYAGGRVSALLSKKEMQQQQLQAGTYVTVMIDGKEVRAIVKQEATKGVAKQNRVIKSRRK